MGAYLDVEESLTGRRWVGPDLEVERLAEALAQSTGHPRPLCAILARLGVQAEDVPGYLAPSIRDLLPDPRSLRDMEIAAQRLNVGLQRKENIAIFADYDVDGGSSAALILDWLRDLGHDATLYVPDRIDEGYGPNVPAMEALARTHSLIICVDCGTLSFDPIAAAKGADVVVLDHHLGAETLPKALAVVNPNRQDEDGALGHLCAAAVVFLFLVEANRQRRISGARTPDLMQALDLVALATVADVAELRGVNRAFVRQGLRIMGNRGRPGLSALADVARLDSAPTAYHLGYVLGPRVNAGGRIGKADLGARLLSSRDPHEAAAMAQRLHDLNAERREIEDQVRAAAIAQIEERADDAALAWAAGEGWHPGVVGIVASRLKEATNRPSIVIGLEGDEGKGSGRSVPGIDLGSLIQRVTSEGLLLKGGGHRMAAGLTVARDKLDAAMARISELVAKQPVDVGGPRDLRLDGVVMPGAATVELIEQFELAGPFGAGAPGPRFTLPAMRISFAKEVGTGHLKLRLTDGQFQMDAIAFSAFDSALGPTLSEGKGASFHVAGRLEINQWQGRKSVQLRLEDAAPAQ